MKTYEQLTDLQKTQAHSYFKEKFLNNLITRQLVSENNNIQESINRAIRSAYRMKTPWFISEYIWDATYTENGKTKKISDWIHNMTIEQTKETLYYEDNECAVSIKEIEKE